MIIGFGDLKTDHLFNGQQSRHTRKFPADLHRIACRKLDMINAAAYIEDLKVPPGNQLKKLKGVLSLFYSVRINDQFRIIFIWDNGHADKVKIVDYH